MFSVIPANRPCITDFITISPTQFAFSFPSRPHFSHLVVFILPGQTLPPDTAAGVYVKLPGSTDFRFLGAIANEKPSAIFKVNLPAPKQQQLLDIAEGLDEMTDSVTTAYTPAVSAQITQPEPGTDDINLGISVEPASIIQAQLATLQSQQIRSSGSSQSPNSPSSALAMVIQRPPPPTKLLAQRIIKNAFNFLASFVGGADGQEVVPLKSFQDWWAKFERRVENDPGFLERDEGI